MLPFFHAKKREHKKKNPLQAAGFDLAEWTGLEPATPGVTGRYSNRLNYHSVSVCSAGFHRLCDELLVKLCFLASPRGFEPLYSP